MRLTHHDLERIQARLWQIPPQLEDQIPSDTVQHIKDYVLFGTPTGHFLAAVFTNNLFEAVNRADIHNKLAITAIVQLVKCYCPPACWGSTERLHEWMLAHRKLLSPDPSPKGPIHPLCY